MWWRTRHGRGPPARHHLLEQFPGPAEHPCRVPLATAHTPGTAPFPRSGPNTHERSGEEPFKQSSQAQKPRSHTAPASLQKSRTHSISLPDSMDRPHLGMVTRLIWSLVIANSLAPFGHCFDCVDDVLRRRDVEILERTRERNRNVRRADHLDGCFQIAERL